MLALAGRAEKACWLLEKRGTGVSVKLDGEATSAGSCGQSRGSEARASPSSLTEKQRVLVGLAEEARHETSLGDSILRRVYGFEAQKSYQVDSSFGKTFARKD